MADQDTVSQHTEDHRQEEEEAAAAAERAAGEGFRNFLVNLLPDSAHTCIAPIALRVNGMVSAAAKDPVVRGLEAELQGVLRELGLREFDREMHAFPHHRVEAPVMM